jgi:hypothetical protein
MANLALEPELETAKSKHKISVSPKFPPRALGNRLSSGTGQDCLLKCRIIRA